VSEPDRIDCPHAARCPGCPLIGEPLAGQLEAKAQRLRAALAPFPALREPQPAAVRAAETAVGYRTRAKLVVGAGPRLGLFARGAEHEVVDLPGCRVLAPALAGAAAALRRLLAAPPPECGAVLRPEAGGGALRAVDLRELRDGDAAGVLLTLVLRAPPAPEPCALEAACDALDRELPALRGIAVSHHDGRGPRLLGGPPRAVRGPDLHRDRLRPGAPFALVSAGSFAQAHRGQAGAIHAEVERALGPLDGRRALELYAGSASLGLALAAAGARVTAVESFAPAAAAAARAASEQGLAGIDARTGSAAAWLARLVAAGERFDVVVANPPRRGLEPRVREALAKLGADRVVYVSCEPATLARDLAHLARLGLRAERLVPFDMMPLTAEVECVAVLRRGPPPAPVVLFEDDSLLALDAAPFAPRTPAGALPLQPLERGASGVCLFARSRAAATRFDRARSEHCYLVLVRGVARAAGRIAAARHRRLAVLAGHALLEVRAEGSDAHALRRRLAAIGEPVLGDARHGHRPSNRHLFERFGLDRPFLHRASIEVADSRTGRTLRVESPLAPDLALVVARLGGDAKQLAEAAA